MIGPVRGITGGAGIVDAQPPVSPVCGSAVGKGSGAAVSNTTSRRLVRSEGNAVTTQTFPSASNAAPDATPVTAVGNRARVPFMSKAVSWLPPVEPRGSRTAYAAPFGPTVMGPQQSSD